MDLLIGVALDGPENEKYSLTLSVTLRKRSLQPRRGSIQCGETPNPYSPPALILGRFVWKRAALIEYRVRCYARTYEGGQVKAENIRRSAIEGMIGSVINTKSNYY